MRHVPKLFLAAIVLIIPSGIFAQGNSARVAERIISNFNNIDKDSSKSLSSAELQTVIEKFPKNRKKALLKLVKAIDVDGNGEISLEELKKVSKAKADTLQKQPQQADLSGKKEIYKKVDGRELPLYIYSPKEKSSKPVAAAVFFHGGGWANGSPKQFEPQCKYLAERGMVGITVEYRLARNGIYVGDCVEDAKSAMRWVRENAEKLGIDPNRVASGGGSAGGHLGAAVSVLDGYNAKTDNLKVSAAGNVMLLFNPAIAMAKHSDLPEDYNTAIESAQNEKFKDERSKLSPLNFAEKKQGPTIIFFGTNDKLLIGAKAYEKVSSKAGNNCIIKLYEGQGHGFFNRGEYFDKTVKDMDDFLVKQGWLLKKD